MKNVSFKNWQPVIIGLGVIGILILAISGLLGKIVGRAASPLVDAQTWISQKIQAFEDFLTVPRDVTVLQQENANLKNEVSQLQAEVLILKQQVSETEILYALLDFARTRPENKYIAASVIGRDPSPFLNYVIIDHGSDDGIFKGMPVVTQQGLVGRVDAVTATAARVQLITDPKSVVNVRLEKAKIDAQISGSISGDITLELVNLDANLEEGDLVLTSGLGGSYPVDILIGQVLIKSKPENSLFLQASIQPVVDFSNLRAVLVITNFKPVDYSPLTTSDQ
jgi:rod shape-determining protein MreC